METNVLTSTFGSSVSRFIRLCVFNCRWRHLSTALPSFSGHRASRVRGRSRPIRGNSLKIAILRPFQVTTRRSEWLANSQRFAIHETLTEGQRSCRAFSSTDDNLPESLAPSSRKRRGQLLLRLRAGVLVAGRSRQHLPRSVRRFDGRQIHLPGEELREARGAFAAAQILDLRSDAEIVATDHFRPDTRGCRWRPSLRITRKLERPFLTTAKILLKVLCQMPLSSLSMATLTN